MYSFIKKQGEMTMYLFDFFHSLTLLDKEKIPDISIFPDQDVFYFGYCEKDDIKDVICGNDHYYVAYVYRNDVKKLNYLGIDYIVEYIEELNREPYYTFPGEYAAIYEAVWLFDELNVIDNPFFNMVLSVPLPSISSSLSDENTDDELTIVDFQGNPLIKKLYMAQFMYYIKKYLAVKSKQYAKVKIETDTLLKVRLIHVLKDYLQNIPLNYKSQIYTKENNPEFDDFVQQIGCFAEHELWD